MSNSQCCMVHGMISDAKRDPLLRNLSQDPQQKRPQISSDFFG